MSTKDHIPAAREIIKAFNVANWTTFKNHLTMDATYNEIGTQRQIRGAGTIVHVMQEWKRAMSDANGTITMAIASGPNVSLEILWEGTHNGPLTTPAGVFPASGLKQRTPASMTMRFQGDKVVEIHHYFDLMTLLQQIGAVPAGARA